MTRSATPFHCPYCAEDDLFPREDGWECRACLRAFQVTFLGQLPHPGLDRAGQRELER
jgi:transposase-like protein